jgi:retinol dehydrogenase 14
MEQRHSGPMTGKTVLVTGATSGIGKATALGLAVMGARLAITGRSRERTEDAAVEIRAAGGGRVDVFVADLCSQAEVRRLADEALHCLSRIDVLVWSTTSAVTGTLGISPWMASSELSLSTISRHFCSPTCSCPA